MSYFGSVAQTRQQILDAARRLYNQHGLNQVGVREVARAVGISAGNLSYHFPTRDDLVEALLMELHDLNKRTVFAALPDDFSLVTLYRTAVGALRNMLPYRFVLLSYVDAVRASPKLQAIEAGFAKRRRARHDRMLGLLIANHYLEPRTGKRSDVLYEQGMMISSGWLRAASLRDWSDARAVLHFAKLGCALLEPHCTPSGARQMGRILDGVFDEE